MKQENESRSLVILTGMSGSGKHTAFKAFEDLGYFCVDNLPTALIPRLIEMSSASGGKLHRLAVVVDVRLRESVAAFERLFRELKTGVLKDLRTTVIFVDASDEVLARRYSETRRVHPLATGGGSLVEGIQAERRKLTPVRALADLVIDTSDFTVHDLRNFIYQDFRRPGSRDDLRVSVVSFGFKYGIPLNSDLVFDLRFLPNPNFVPELKEKTGGDPAVVSYMKKLPETEEILNRIHEMLEFLLPRYVKEGKNYLTVSVGCTGGRHRSVMVANELKRRLRRDGHSVNVIHRDVHLREQERA